MEWSEFAERLSRELARLDRDTILIIREHDEGRHYVQAMCEPDRRYAEAVSNNFLEGPLLLTPADEEVLSESGWQPPTADWAPANWWTELAPLATVDDFARLADMMVTALRDVQGVRRPADLVYESFHRHGTGLIELVDLGLPHADPARVTEHHGTEVTETAEQAMEQLAEEAAEQATGQRQAAPPVVDAVVDSAHSAPTPDTPSDVTSAEEAPTEPAAAEPAGRVTRGVQLWRYDGNSATPVAVYDASSARWTGPDPD